MSFLGRFFGVKPKVRKRSDEFDEFLNETTDWIFYRAVLELRYGGFTDAPNELPDDIKSAVVQYMLGASEFIAQSLEATYDINPWLSSFRARMLYTLFEGGPTDERALVEFSRANGGIENPYSLFAVMGSEDASKLILLRGKGISEDEWIKSTKLHFLAVSKTLDGARIALH